MTTRKEGCSSPDSSTGTAPLMVDHPDQTTDNTAVNVVKKDNRSSLDRLLQGYTKFMDSGLHQDRGLKLLQWTLWMISYYYNDKAFIRDALKKLYNELSFSRYVLRLLQLPPALEAARNGSWGASSDSHKGIHKFLGKLMAWSMVGYYPLEHGAYLQWMTPKLLFPKTGGPSRLAEKLSAWSCRFWLAYTLAEIVQSWLSLREESKKLQMIESKKKNDESDDDDVDVDSDNDNNKGKQQLIITNPQPNLAAMKNLRLQIVRDLLFTLPAIHWSLPNWDRDPWLSEPFCNTLMWLESLVCMYQSICKFQQS